MQGHGTVCGEGDSEPPLCRLLSEKEIGVMGWGRWKLKEFFGKSVVSDGVLLGQTQERMISRSGQGEKMFHRGRFKKEHLAEADLGEKMFC